MNRPPRVAFFTDSFHEVNGVALTSRQFDAFARRRRLPFLSLHAGPATGVLSDGSLTTIELERSPAAIPIERDMSWDPLFMRHRRMVFEVVNDFQPDLIHITGPSDVGILGAYLARQDLHIPLVASWHTNVHEFGAERLSRLISFMPDAPRDSVTGFAGRQMLNLFTWFYGLANVLLAPNRELVEMLQRETDRPTFLMERGSDTLLFDPAKRSRVNGPFTLGFVGRVTPEKNVRFLVDLERALIACGRDDYRFLIAGGGSELPWLSEHLRRADFAGVLKGEALATAYANMDLFVFPSETDTFGNVIIEAFASGVPVVVTASGGPKFLVTPGVTGFIAGNAGEFIAAVLRVMTDRELHHTMRLAARADALARSWDAVFEKVYDDAYRLALERAAPNQGSLPSS